VHCPLRGGEQYKAVVTFFSREKEEWGAPADHPARELAALGHRGPRTHRAVDTYGRATQLGDAAHPTTQYMAQGACMAIEDAVTLGQALRVNGNDFDNGPAAS